MSKMKVPCDPCQLCCLIPLIAIVLSVLSFIHLMKATSHLIDHPKINLTFQTSNSFRAKSAESVTYDRSQRQQLLSKPVTTITSIATTEASPSFPINQTVELIISTPSGHHTVILHVHPEWAPLGAARFLQLVDDKFYDEARFFRVLKNFMAQTGIPAVPNSKRPAAIKDDHVLRSNKRGTVTFAHAGPNTRSSQIFFNFRDNSFLDKQMFAPFAEVVVGMEEGVDSLFNSYGEGGKGDGSDGKGPNQGRIQREGNGYLISVFPKLSYIVTARRKTRTSS